MFSKSTREEFFQQIAQAEAEFISYVPSNPLDHLNTRYTLYDLRKKIEHPNFDEEALEMYFTKRWATIQETDTHYLHDLVNPANRACIGIAKILGKLLNRPYLTLLMPSLLSVPMSAYINSSYEDELPLHYIVLSEMNSRVIHIDDVLDAAQEDGTLKHTSLFKQEPRSLNASEKKKVLSRHPAIEAVYEALQARIHFRHHGDTLGANLQMFIEGLRAGSAMRGAKDTDSGPAANSEIILFSGYLSTISDDNRAKLFTAEYVDSHRGTPISRAQSVTDNIVVHVTTFESIWKLLCREKGTDYTDLVYCVGTAADRIESILKANSWLYNIASYEGASSSGQIEKLDRAVLDAQSALRIQLPHLEKHIFYGKEGDDTIANQLFEALYIDQLFAFTENEINYLVTTFLFLTNTTPHSDILDALYPLLETLKKRTAPEILFNAMLLMTPDEQHTLHEFTGFEIPIPTAPASPADNKLYRKHKLFLFKPDSDKQLSYSEETDDEDNEYDTKRPATTY